MAEVKHSTDDKVRLLSVKYSCNGILKISIEWLFKRKTKIKIFTKSKKEKSVRCQLIKRKFV